MIETLLSELSIFSCLCDWSLRRFFISCHAPMNLNSYFRLFNFTSGLRWLTCWWRLPLLTNLNCRLTIWVANKGPKSIPLPGTGFMAGSETTVHPIPSHDKLNFKFNTHVRLADQWAVRIVLKTYLMVILFPFSIFIRSLSSKWIESFTWTMTLTSALWLAPIKPVGGSTDQAEFSFENDAVNFAPIRDWFLSFTWKLRNKIRNGLKTMKNNLQFCRMSVKLESLPSSIRWIRQWQLDLRHLLWLGKWQLVLIGRQSRPVQRLLADQVRLLWYELAMLMYSGVQLCLLGFKNGQYITLLTVIGPKHNRYKSPLRNHGPFLSQFLVGN